MARRGATSSISARASETEKWVGWGESRNASTIRRSRLRKAALAASGIVLTSGA